MERRFYHWLTEKFPQNYLIKYSFRGAIILTLFSFLFTMLYHPLYFHGTNKYPYPQLMGMYCITGGISVFLLSKLLRLVPWFAKEEEWTFIKEVLAITIVLQGIGISIFLLTFIVQPESAEWTVKEFVNESNNAYLIGGLPFLISLFINITNKPHSNDEDVAPIRAKEEMIQIESKLKKETLEFYPSQFLYAESDGNYVVFYLNEENEIRKKTIRNSISQVEQQLTGQPYFFRTHRSFIVNLEKVTGKDGNTSGYRLNLEGLSSGIPVSRQNVPKFDELFPIKA